jgi:isochorismate pyruvate lyase
MLGKTSSLYVKIARATTPAYNSAAMQNDATSKPAPRPAKDCATMAELRAAIDQLDDRLVALLAQRQSYIERAAVLKRDRAAVRDEARIEEVIAKVVATAKAAGLSSAIAEPVWRLLIERSIAHEFEAFDAKG